MNTRVYNDKIELYNEDVKTFWAKRSVNPIEVKTVLLGDDKGGQIERNNKECSILKNAVMNLKTLRILDVGCGIGRWAENLQDKIENYVGIDFTADYINFANKKFINDKNINFYEMSACDITPEILNQNYNLVICTGVLMYINDCEISKILSNIHQISPDIFYLQESISIMDGRLTLNNFESKELKTKYSAIYRTKYEYEQFFENFDIIKTDLFLDETNGGREETNARYWILRGI